MKISSLIAATLIVGLTAFVPVAHSANLVVDGDFTDPAFSGTFQTFNAGATMGAWTVTSGSVNVSGGSVDQIGTYWVPPTVGGRSVDLDGASPGGISQVINLNPGQYLLTFSLSGNPDAGSSPNKLVQTSIVGGLGSPVINSFSYDTSIKGNTSSNMKYDQESVLFSISGIGPTTLSFLSLDAANSAWGAVIGNVAINAVPLPPAVLLFISGLTVLVGFGAYKKSREQI